MRERVVRRVDEQVFTRHIDDLLAGINRCYGGLQPRELLRQNAGTTANLENLDAFQRTRWLKLFLFDWTAA